MKPSRRTTMKNKWLIFTAALLTVLLLCLYLIPVKRNMEERFSCVVYDQHDESYSDQVNITFTGTYTDYFFRNDSFAGRIEIEGYTFLSPKANDIEITVGDGQLSWILEHIPGYPDLSLKYLGSIYSEEDFEKFFLWLMVPEEENPSVSHGRYFLAYPEITMEEINEILQ